jgi:stage V sporulation protein B
MAQQTITQESAGESRAPDVARVAGRGTIYITAAKLWFIISGFALEFTLAALMTSDRYGVYKVVIGAVSIINAVIITGTYQTVSRYVSESETKADSVKAASLKLQVLIGGVAAGGFFLLAPITAGYLNDPGLAKYLRIAALITLSYSFYAVFTGYFNGQRKFLTQAALDMGYSTLKLSFIVLLVWLGYGVGGAVSGFAMAAAGVLLLSVLAAGWGRSTEPVRSRELVKFQSYLILFTLVLNLLQRIDLLLVKSLSSPDPTIASANAGYYGAATNLANITYQVIISVTFVVFPLVSRASFAEDRGQTQSYISNTVRYTLMIMAGVATLFSANASEALQAAYRPEYQAGTGALGIIAFGMLAFGLVHVLTTIITASGRPGVSLLIGFVTLGISAGLNSLLIPRYGIAGAAAATTIAMFIGAASCAGYLLAKFGAFVRPVSVLRIGLAAGGLYAASILYSAGSRTFIAAELIALGVGYVVMLFALGELGREDIRLIRRVLGKA